MDRAAALQEMRALVEEIYQAIQGKIADEATAQIICRSMVIKEKVRQLSVYFITCFIITALKDEVTNLQPMRCNP